MITHSSCGEHRHQSLDLVPSSQQELVRKCFSYREKQRSFKDKALGSLGLANHTIQINSFTLKMR